MTICHTADLHIRRDTPQRLDALTAVLKAAEERGAELVVIAGDLFDRESDVRSSISEVRERLADSSAAVLISSGNHDAEAFGSGAFFGEHVSVLGAEPVELDGCSVAAVPFDASLAFERLGQRLQETAALMTEEKPKICLFHGELVDSFFSRSELGDEGERRYMPARLSYFREAGFDYVLAGHFHAAFSVWEYAPQRYFCYPGSPIAITTRELGRRAVNIFDLGAPPAEHYLNTPRVEQCAVTLNPFEDRDPVSTLRERCSSPEPGVQLLVRVDGFVDAAALGKSEEELVGEMQQLLSQHELAAPPKYDLQDVGAILAEPLFQAFDGRLKSRHLSEADESAVRQAALQAFMQAGGAGESRS